MIFGSEVFLDFTLIPKYVFFFTGVLLINFYHFLGPFRFTDCHHLTQLVLCKYITYKYFSKYNNNFTNTILKFTFFRLLFQRIHNIQFCIYCWSKFCMRFSYLHLIYNRHHKDPGSHEKKETKKYERLLKGVHIQLKYWSFFNTFLLPWIGGCILLLEIKYFVLFWVISGNGPRSSQVSYFRRT